MSVELESTKPTWMNLLKAGLMGGVIAAIVNAVLYFVAQVALGGPPQVAPQPGMPIGPLQIVAIVPASIIPAIVAALLLWGLTRITDGASRIFLIIAIIFGLLSLYPPFTQAAGMGDSIFLALMHIATATAITGALLRAV